MGALSKHLRSSADDEDYMDDVEDNDADPDVEREIDPRWKDLKKILDNN